MKYKHLKQRTGYIFRFALTLSTFKRKSETEPATLFHCPDRDPYSRVPDRDTYAKRERDSRCVCVADRDIPMLHKR